jgi:hypothetical protein
MSKYLKHKENNGFAALLIVIILGGIALASVLSASTGIVWSIRGGVDAKKSNQAKALVNACAEMALEALREYHVYSGEDSLLISGNSCTHTVTDTGGDSRSIVVSGTVGDITKKINITTNGFNPMVISSWQEVP